jgi:hypothetical protein
MGNATIIQALKYVLATKKAHLHGTLSLREILSPRKYFLVYTSERHC